MKKGQKILSLVLALIMMVSIVPFASAEENNDYKVGDTIKFGSYPQSKVTDETLLLNLNSIELKWTSYGYTNTDMQFADVCFGTKKYRAVKFSRYRGESNGYATNTIYWFEYEPIEWIILDPNEGLVLSKTIVDSQPYNDTVYGDSPYYKDSNKSIFVDDYENSSIRSWLNNEFYNTAFSYGQKKNIKNSNLSDLNLDDKVFCLSKNEATNVEYGFSKGYSTYCSLRRAVGTDYAKVQGLYVATASEIIYKGRSHWWLRVPANGRKIIDTVYDGGQIRALYATNVVWQGTRPAMRINLDNLKKGNYKINLYSSMPAMITGKNTTVNFIAELQNNGETVYDDFDYSIVISDPDVIEVRNLAEHPEGLFFDVLSKKEGVARITLTETLSGAVYSTKIEVKDNVTTYNSKAMPIYTNFGEYNGYVDGMYIADYSCANSEDDNYCNMSFNVYNTTNTIGVVEIYDSNGNLENIYPIDRHNGTKITGFGDLIYKWGVLLFDDLLNGELMTFRQESYSTKTTIKNIKVEKGGYIKITNSMINSDSAAALNMVGYIISAICFCKDVVDSVDDAVELYKNMNKSLIQKILGGDFKNFSDKMIDKCTGIVGKDISIGTFNEVCTALINGGTSLLTQSDFNIVKITTDSAKTLGIEFAEDTFTKYLGGYGLLIETLFTWNEVVDLTCWTIDLCQGYYNAFEIFVDTSDEKLCNNGVMISKESGMSDFSENNFVMRSIVITEDKDMPNVSKDYLNDIADNYIVRDIYLEKDGVIVQPNESVIVSIPIPENYDASRCAVYWLKDDGTAEVIPTTVFGGYIHFQTDHFSHYALVELHEHKFERFNEVKESCTSDGYTTYACKCGESYTKDYVNATNHIDENLDYKCDYNCGYEFEKPTPSDPADDCSCNCHQGGIAGFFFKIINFFQKLFGMNKVCACGAKH